MGSKSTPRRATMICGGFILAAAACSALADGNGKWNSGKEVYDKVCGYCHEPQPGLGPKILQSMPASDIRERVRKGYRAMPPFRQTEIDDEALTQVIGYLKREER